MAAASAPFMATAAATILRYRFKRKGTWRILHIDTSSPMTLLDVKRAIVAHDPGMVDRRGGPPFDLRMTQVETGERYSDDDTWIPRNSNLVVICVPAVAASMNRLLEPGRYTTRLHVNGQQSVEQPSTTADGSRVSSGDDEALLRRHVVDASVAAATNLYGGGGGVGRTTLNMSPPSMMMPMRPPPSTYTCHRCGQGGHYIRHCPTHGDPDFDRRSRLRRRHGQDDDDVATTTTRQKRHASQAGGGGGGGGGRIIYGRPPSIPRNAWRRVPDDDKDATTTIYVFPDEATGIEARWRVDMLADARAAETATTLTAATVSVAAECEIKPAFATCGLCYDFLREAVTVSCCASRFCRKCLVPFHDGATGSGSSCPTCHVCPLEYQSNERAQRMADESMHAWKQRH